MTYQAYDTNAPRPRRGHTKNLRKPRRMAAATNRPSQLLFGPAAIAAYMLNDPLLVGVVNNLVAGGELGHHYREGILCSTRVACRLCMFRLTESFGISEPNDD